MQHEEMINERIDQLIAEYLSGSLTADAFQELKNWSQQSDETRMYVRKSDRSLVFIGSSCKR